MKSPTLTLPTRRFAPRSLSGLERSGNRLPAHLLFHQWLLVASGIVFALYMAVRTGGLAFIVEHDSTFISDVVLLIFLSVTLYCGQRSWAVSREVEALDRILAANPGRGQGHMPVLPPETEGSLAHEYYSTLFADRLSGPAAPGERAQGSELNEILSERIHGPHHIGWYLTESLTKLGLLGTVIGFMIMLTALVGSQELEISAMQSILRSMAAGMGIKIIATVVGLMCNMVLALQFVLIERTGERFVADVVWFAHRWGAGHAPAGA